MHQYFASKISFFFFFYGELCEMEKDKTYPDRVKKGVHCQTAYAGPGKKAFKESILEVCTQRNDIANQSESAR